MQRTVLGRRLSRPSFTVALVIALAVVGTGYIVTTSRAAGPAAVREVEDAVLASPAKTVSDSRASGGRAVSFTGAPAPTPTPRPTAGPTPAPTPAPGSGGIPAGFPNASNTGVKPGTQLAVINGNQNLTQAGQVLENKDIRGCVRVQANNVTIRNSKITCDPGMVAVIRLTAQNLVLEDVTIVGLNSGSGAIAGDLGLGITARRLNISGADDGIKIRGNVTLEDSFIHDLSPGGGCHCDALQSDVSGANNIVIRHNTLLVGAGNAAYQYAGVTGALFENNYMDGGNYTLNGNGVVTFKDNLFGRSHKFGPTTGGSSATWINNRYADNGAPIR